MCGICGQYNFQRSEPIVRPTLVRMTASMTHRGPDDEGYHIAGELGLGFRRLSIIDLSSGHQPMSDRESSVWLVFNGEIYNFRELKRELESHGHTFRTTSDTEVIILGYKQWGPEVLNRLNGMFGLALWDVHERRLMIARDAMGIKPIYYRNDDGRLTFGSEIRPILAAEETDRPTIDPVALNLFLRYRYTPSPLTIFDKIRKLAPGTMLLASKDGVAQRRWYQYKPRPFTPPKSPAEAERDLLDLYKQAVKRHLISDVPVGLLLSGGVDSGMLLSLMNLEGASWPTFTVGYGTSFKDDELVDAEETARILSARHTAVSISKEKFEESLPRIIRYLEEPVATSSIVPMYFVCERAHQDVKVALVGQGPDELFGGYPRHVGLRYSPLWLRLPRGIRKSLSRMINALPRNEMLKRGVYSLDTPDRMRKYQAVFSIMPGEVVDGLFKPGTLPPQAGDMVLECWKDLAASMDETDELGGLQFLEIRSSLPDELLMYSDKLSMAHSLELRVPYLDRTIVEYVQRLPAAFKVRRGTRKWLHKRVCRATLPASIIRRKKRGFAVNVVDDWFRNSLSKKMEAYFRDDHSLMYQFLRYERALDLLNDHKARRADNHKLLFSLIVFEEWLRSGRS
jgi:asparagine synthase (glutamine-hydrolysing)